MACQCGGCSGGGGGSRDAGFADVSVTVQDDGGGATVCDPPMVRVQTIWRQATSANLAGAGRTLSEGNFTRLRCWPLWTWALALLLVARWRS